MSAIYAIGCRHCRRKCDVGRSSGPYELLKPGFATANLESLVAFIGHHGNCNAFVYGDSVEHGDLHEFRDDTDAF